MDFTFHQLQHVLHANLTVIYVLQLFVQVVHLFIYHQVQIASAIQLLSIKHHQAHVKFAAL